MASDVAGPLIPRCCNQMEEKCSSMLAVKTAMKPSAKRVITMDASRQPIHQEDPFCVIAVLISYLRSIVADYVPEALRHVSVYIAMALVYNAQSIGSVPQWLYCAVPLPMVADSCKLRYGTLCGSLLWWQLCLDI